MERNGPEDTGVCMYMYSAAGGGEIGEKWSDCGSRWVAGAALGAEVLLVAGGRHPEQNH